jgi:hypothetical protein|tara:strand:+ start:4025 stop:4492 length:468 start_codon:yes stop_codon:yes gene_type:complete
MAFSGNFLCTSFKIELLKGTHDFTAASNKYKLAMFTNSAVPSDMGGSGSTMNASVVNYATNNEVSGTGYSAGGNFLTSITPSNPGSGTTATTSFSNLVFPTVTITNARGAVIYNTTASNKAVCVLDFGADKAATAGDFTIVFPTNNASNAIIRIA